MKRRLLPLIAVVAVVFLMGAVAFDKYGFEGPNVPINNAGSAFTAIPLNGAAATLVFRVPRHGGWKSLSFTYSYVHANNGVLSLTCTGCIGNTCDYTITQCDAASTEGECLTKTSGILKTGTLSGDSTSHWGRMAVDDFQKVECTVAHSGTPAAGDTLSVWYTRVGG